LLRRVSLLTDLVSECLVPISILHYVIKYPFPVSVYFGQRTTHTRNQAHSIELIDIIYFM